MTQQEVNRLIDKYMDGKTSLQEERRLAIEVNRPNAPAEWKVVGEMLGELTLGEAVYEHTMALRRRRHFHLYIGWAAAACIAFMAISGYFEYRKLKVEQAEELAQQQTMVVPPVRQGKKSDSATMLPAVENEACPPPVKPMKRKQHKRAAPVAQTETEAWEEDAPQPDALPQVTDEELAQVERNYRMWQLRQAILVEKLELDAATEAVNRKYEEYLSENKNNIEI